MTRTNHKIEESIRLAKVKGAYGIKGELFILPFIPRAKWIYNLSQISLIRDHQMTLQHTSCQPIINSQTNSSFTFKIENFRNHKGGYIIKLQDCNDRTEAEKWRGAFVSAPISSFTSQPGEEIYLIELKGFTVINLGQQIGPIVSFSSNGYQDLIQVKKDGHLYDIPFVKEFLVQINWQDKHVYMNLPEGLLDEIPIRNVTHLSKNKSFKGRKKAHLFATT